MILSFDIGTTILKGALFSPSGELIRQDRRILPGPERQEGVYNEVNPSGWTASLASLSRRLLEETPGKTVSALCVSGNGPTLICADHRGRPLAPAMTWLDRRGREESEEIREKTGRYIDPSFYLPKILWLRKHRRELFDRTAFFQGCPEFILQSLTGVPSNLVTGPLLGEYTWTKELISGLDLPDEKFPRDRKPGEILGPLLAGPAEEWGLPAGIPVVAGGPDFVLTLIGTAAVSPGRVCDRSGTSEGLNLCSPRLNPDRRLMSFEHPVEGLYNTSGSISNSGRAMDWFRRQFLGDTRDFEALFRSAGEVPPGSEGLLFLPYLTGERAPLWDPRLRGAFVGLNDRHGEKEMLRAVLESVAFALRHVMEVMEEKKDGVEDLRITGNPARSDLWNQIKADITGRRILVPEIPEAELTGGAILTLKALGRIGSLEEGADRLIRFRKTFHPREEYRERYDRLYALYRQAGESLRTVSHGLAEIS